MYFIGIDVGTTGTKAAIVDENGNILGKGYQEYALITDVGGKVEQNAEDWWTATIFAVRAAVSNFNGNIDEISAISMSTQGGTTVAVDTHFKPLSPAYTWMDRRATAECEQIINELGNDYIYKKTGWQANACFDPAKIRWMNRHQTDIWEKAALFVTTLEFINYRLTGKTAIDPTNAAMRQLVDINKGDWDEKLVHAAKTTKEKLPECLPTGTFLGHLTDKAAEELGLGTSVKVFNGAHDQYCAAIGSGAVNDGDMLLSTGTTWVVLGVTSKPVFTNTYIAPGIHPCKGIYGNIASLRSAGSALKWLIQLTEQDYKKMDSEAERRRESAKELYYYPYYAGAGFPHNMDNLHACIFGMQLMHDKYDLGRALMEGVAFETRSVLEEFSSFGSNIRSLKMVGGASKSELWSRLTCDITGCAIQFPKEADTCCVGAAMIAAVGQGIYEDYVHAGKHMVHYREEYAPNDEQRAFYNEKYGKYQQGLKMLKQLYTNPA